MIGGSNLCPSACHIRIIISLNLRYGTKRMWQLPIGSVRPVVPFGGSIGSVHKALGAMSRQGRCSSQISMRMPPRLGFVGFGVVLGR